MSEKAFQVHFAALSKDNFNQQTGHEGKSRFGQERLSAWIASNSLGLK